METLSQMPKPHLWTCDRCGEQIRLWDWGYHPPRQGEAGSFAPPIALCTDCKIAAALPEQQAFMHWEAALHNKVRSLVGDPPGTLIAWRWPIPDRAQRENSSGELIRFPACVYLIRVDHWDFSWPQFKGWWGTPEESTLLVMLGARVIAEASQRQQGSGSWLFTWWWPQPERTEICQLDPPHASLTDGEAVLLNKARQAFYVFKERRGLDSGTMLAWPHDETTWHIEGTRARNVILSRGHNPIDGRIAAEMGVTNSTYNRRKKEWGPPDAERIQNEPSG